MRLVNHSVVRQSACVGNANQWVLLLRRWSGTTEASKHELFPLKKQHNLKLVQLKNIVVYGNYITEHPSDQLLDLPTLIS